MQNPNFLFKFRLKPLQIAWPGYLIFIAIIALSFAVLWALINYANISISNFYVIFSNIINDDYIRHITYFSFLQASLSTFIAIILAIPVARFLYRRQFWGKPVLLKIFILAFIMPTMVSVFGIIAIHGRQGYFNDILYLFGQPRSSYLYGLNGILLAHIFINMPFSARIFLSELENIPPEYWRLSKQLGFSEWQIFKQIEWPMMRLSLPSLAALLFILHFTSFATVLTLGGGPAATTLEVAIFQALKFDFDLAKGATLALLQLSLCVILTLFLHRFSNQINILNSIGMRSNRPKPTTKISYITDITVIILISITLIMPLSSIFINAITQVDFSILSKPIFFTALTNSIILAFCAASLACLLSLMLLFSKRSLKAHGFNNFGYYSFSSIGNIILIVPSLVFGMGLFLLLRQHINIFKYGLVIILIINALMALPYMLKTLSPAIESMSQLHEKLTISLGIKGINRFKYIDWPTLRKSIGRAFALGLTISFGDFGVIALFGNEQTLTLPMLLYQTIGAYKNADGAIIACILVIIAFGLYAFFERLIGGKNVNP